MLLSELKGGQAATISRLSGGRQVQRRLFEIGLAPGVKVEMVSRHPFHGPVVVKINHSRVVIGRRVAAQVEVEVC
jgi:ferrous iron transport protein A